MQRHRGYEAPPGGHGRPDMSEEQQDVEHLRVISEQLQKRLRVISSEGAVRGDDAPAVSMELADGRVHCVESVGGDGRTARAVRQALVDCANALPFMGQSIPLGYTAVKDACAEYEWDHVAVPMGEAVSVLRGKCSGQTADSVREALEFWAILGFVLVHGDWLIPRPTDMINLVRPLVHHDPLAALDKTLSLGPSTSRDPDASADWVVPGFAELGKAAQAEVRGMVERLVDDNVLCEALHPHLKGWKDARDNAERTALLGVLERFGLVVEHLVAGNARQEGGGGGGEWLCTCRMDSKPSEKAIWDEGIWKAFAGATKMVPVVRYTPDYAPSALFPHIVATQMSNREYKAEHRREQILKGGMLSVQLLAAAERHECFQLALTKGPHGATQIVVAASSVGLLRSLCAAVEQVMSWRLPGLSHSVKVHFSVSGETGAHVWKLNPELTLGAILASKEWDRVVRVEKVETGRQLKLKVREIFETVPGIFISHSWKDLSREVGPVLRDQVEHRMRELVWYDAQMMSSEDQFQSRMLEGVKESWAVFILLSREALASGNCLREICMAREQQMNPKANTRIIILAMEEEVTYASIDAWPIKPVSFFSAKDNVQRTVHARTVKWVKEQLLGVNIYHEWINSAPEDRAKQSQVRRSGAERRRRQLRARAEPTEPGWSS
ncbi:hypothetical protein T484DRAFT_3124306 [Baffinella frigidus]|nr:hypothetical protein T484DRAFT_3124306 [Cryptophyta sp. CCMP2293]